MVVYKMNICAQLRAVLLLLISFLPGVLYANDQTAKSDSAGVAGYFKYRDNYKAFDQVRVNLAKQIVETQSLVAQLDNSGDPVVIQQMTDVSVDAQVDARLKGFSDSKNRLRKIKVTGGLESKQVALISSVENRINVLDERLQAIKKADKDLTKRKQAIQMLKAELRSYEKIKLRKAPELKGFGEPNGLTVQPADNTFLLEPKVESKNSYDTLKINPLEASIKTEDAKVAAEKAFSALINFVFPNAVAAADYQKPLLIANVANCYIDATDYDNNIQKDLDLAQPEIEVAANLDANSYNKITQLAAELNYSSVEILEYVTNNIKHEHYVGSVKGALGALESGGANDVDHASLLIALLRASSIPARYVRGSIYVQDKPEHLNWWQVKDLAAASSAMAQVKIPRSGTIEIVDGINAFKAEHIWVEACVPYDAYRGDGQDTEGHRWVQVDASFKNYERIDGIEQNQVFDYVGFLSKRTKTLPHEEYASQVLNAVRQADPNTTLADVGTHWKYKPIKLNFLPDSLPYIVQMPNNWSVDIQSSRTAILPSIWRTKMRIYFASQPSFDIPMTDVAQHRITLSFAGKTTTDANKYLEFMNGTRVLDCTNDNLQLNPVFKKDGVVISNLGLPSISLCEDGNYRLINLGVSVRIGNIVGSSDAVLSVTAGNTDRLSFKNISPLNYYALTAYSFNGSDQFIQSRNHRLITNLGIYTKPSDNLDETIGEFLHLILIKYMRYISDGMGVVGQLYNMTGHSGHHIGLTSTRADVEYLFDLPYALQSNSFVVDVPGGVTKSVSITGGALNVDATRLAGYVASHYESYVWQENALTDAVSTVSGLQIAAENNNQVKSFTDAASLKAFILSCAATPNTSSWTASKPLAEMVSAYRAAGYHHGYDDSLKNYFVTNNSFFTSYSTESQINAALAVDFALCYPIETVNSIVNTSFPSGFNNKVTIPKSPVSYSGWEGPIYAAESVKPDGSSASFSFPISSFSGGYTVPTPTPTLYSGSSGGGSSSFFSTGYDFIDAAPVSVDNNFSVINSGIGKGVSTFATIAGDPVNMVTGNMYHDETDITIPTRGLPFIFKRTYNSQTPKDGALGWGWTHSLNQTLEFKDTKNLGKADTIVWTDSSGAEKFISLSPSTTSVNGILNITADKVTIPKGYYFKLLRPHSSGSAQEIVITEKDGIVYRFEAVSGVAGSVARLTSIADVNNHKLVLSYLNGKLDKVTDPDNRTISFRYQSGTSRIKTITLDWDSTVHEYFYDGSGHLTSYRNPLDRTKSIDTASYNYYGSNDGVNRNHRMKRFAYANGYSMTFEYYVNGKASRHYNAEGEITSFSYNDFRREATSTNELGHVKRYSFNKDGLPVEIVDELGGRELYAYAHATDPMLRTKVMDAMGYVTAYEYDANGNLTKQAMPSGGTIVYSHFNAFGRPQLVKNAIGNYTLNLYDSKGNPTDIVIFKSGFGASINPSAFDIEANASQVLSWTKLAYNSQGKLSISRQVKNFSDATTGPYTTFDYVDSVNGTQGVVPVTVKYIGDVNGDGIIGSGEGLGSYTSKYDSQGRLTKGFNAARYPTVYQYDTAGRLLEGTDPLGGKRVFDYDSSGLLTGQSLLAKKNGQVALADNSLIAYDKANRKTTVADASGAITSYEYDDAGNLKKTTSPDGYSVYFDYDAANRVVKAYDAEGNAVERILDTVGRLKQLIDPNGNVTTYTYYGPEQNGRLKRTTSAEGRWTEFTYDAMGQVTRVIDNAGRETLSQYDAMGRVIRVVSPPYGDIVLSTVRPVTKYTYNSLGHQTEIRAGYTDAAGNAAADVLQLQAKYEYDDFGRLLKKYDAANRVWQVTEYDAHGNIKSSKDPLGRITTSSYGYGNVLQATSTTGLAGAAAGTLSTTYDNNGLGQPESISSNNVSYEYQYDTAHRLKKVTDNRGGSYVEYDYSVGGLLNSLKDNHGNKTAYLYDPVGRLTGIRAPDNSLISYVYDAGGRLQQKVFPNNLVTAYQYFKDNKVKSIVTTNAAGVEQFRHDYTYNAAGNTETAVNVISGVTQARSYTYDGLGRLIKERDTVANNDLELIAYDPYGNRRQRTAGGITHFYNHNNLHQITNIREGSNSGPVIADFSYDTNGNMTRKTFSGVTTTINYDSFDRVASVTKNGIAPEQYGYDHGNRRIRKTVGAAVANYHYSGPDIIAEYNSSWTTPQAIYAHGAAMDDPLLRVAANDSSYYHGDSLGSIIGVSNKTGAVIASNRYDAWGNTTVITGNTIQYGYTAREPNANGLVYYRARFYDPQIGRFTQPDPKGFIDGVNTYAYVLNSPVNYIDPWGTSASSPTISSGGGYVSNHAMLSNAYECMGMCHGNAGVTTNFLSDSQQSTLAGYTAVGLVGGAALGACGATVICGTAMAGGMFAASGDPADLAGAGAFGATKSIAANTRGVSNYGGIFTSTKNEAGGEIWTSSGAISQNDFATYVNSGLYKGDVDIISGVHGTAGGTTIVDVSLYEADIARFGDLPGVKVHNFPDLSTEQLNDLMRSPNTTIGGFCFSEACLAPFK